MTGKVVLLAALLLLSLPAPAVQDQPVVAQSTADGGAGVAAVAAKLDSSRRYLVQIDGPPGVPFTARYSAVRVSRNPSETGSGNDDGAVEGTTPYELELVAPRPDLLYWRYSIVVDPQAPAAVTVRIVDAGPR
ncbi:MAG: hypothetical protein IRZ14_11805 [Chloroflexi bacterium]|nr:hypothetical protein [Chloroflexota bacterium]